MRTSHERQSYRSFYYSRRRWVFVGDLIPLLLALGTTLFYMKFEDDLIIYIVLLYPLVFAAWTLMRMPPTIADLCDKARREELALTSLTPREYLFPRFMPPLRLLTAAIAVPMPLADLFLMTDTNVVNWNGNNLGMMILISSMILGLQVSAVAVALIGCYNLAIKLCRPKPNSSHFYTVPFWWCIVLVVTPILFVVGTVFYMATMDRLFRLFSGAMATPGNSVLFFAFPSAVGLGFAAFVSIVARWRWRKLCQIYFTFE